MTDTPASPSPGTQLLSEGELDSLIEDIFGFALEGRWSPRNANTAKQQLRAHIAALTAENAATKERVAGYETELASWRRTAERLKELNNALTASREEMREALVRLGSSEAFLVSRSIKPGDDDELIARMEFAREKARLSQQPEAQGITEKGLLQLFSKGRA